MNKTTVVHCVVLYNLKRASNYIQNSVMRVGSDTFGDPIFQKGLQN